MLDTRVTIQQPTPAQSATGAVTQSWSTFATRWAGIKAGGGREVQVARQKNPETDCIIVMRGRLAVTAKMRVTHTDGRYWDILAVLPRDSKAPAQADILDLHCRSGVGAIG